MLAAVPSKSHKPLCIRSHSTPFPTRRNIDREGEPCLRSARSVRERGHRPSGARTSRPHWVRGRPVRGAGILPAVSGVRREEPARAKPTPGRMPGARARCPRTQCGRDVRAPEGRPLAPTRPAFALVHVALRAHKKALRPKLTRVGESDKRAGNPYTHPKSAGAAYRPPPALYLSVTQTLNGYSTPSPSERSEICLHCTAQAAVRRTLCRRRTGTSRPS